jgi:hypothetical protein
MNTARIEIDPGRAALLYRQYREHRNAYTKIDGEIERIYRQIARGGKVIRALESIRQAGIDALQRPRLALIRADAKTCYLRLDADRLTFSMDRWNNARDTRRKIEVPWPGMKWQVGSAKAVVPLIPIYHRPAAKLENYHILFEADWTGIPVDPMLLRRMGRDAWVVLAAWELTPVERAVLA